MDWELTSVSHGSHDDSHDSLARWLAVCQDPLSVDVGVLLAASIVNRPKNAGQH